jgi:hypothetical protein
MTRGGTWFTEFPHAGGIFRDHCPPDRPSGGSGEPDDTAELNDRIDRQQLLSGESVADDWFEVLEAISYEETRFPRADVIPFLLAIGRELSSGILNSSDYGRTAARVRRGRRVPLEFR